MSRYDDTECETVTITDVSGSRADGWSIKRSDGWSFWVPKDSPIEPAVGHVAHFYGRGIGYEVRGLVIAGVEVFYRTAAEQAEKNQREAEEKERADRARYAATKSANDSRIAALPAEFKDRIHRFRSVNPDFGWKFEGYELFTCEQAVLIAQTLKTEEAIREWYALPYELQKDRVAIDDGHSGNTLGAACALAQWWIEYPASLPMAHGALCPLVGCEDYGCFAATQDAGVETSPAR